TAMVTCYGVNGMRTDTISLFCEMVANNIIPDKCVFTFVLSTCSHARLVAEGAYFVTKTMEVNTTGDIWTMLLSVCQQHRNVKIAEITE
ncbi:hypothetical protein CFOL_v3_12489, partial [Cephalotus follicularis]